MTGNIISQWGKGGLGGQISNADYLGNLQLVAKTWSVKYLEKLNEGPVKYGVAFQEKLERPY